VSDVRSRLKEAANSEPDFIENVLRDAAEQTKPYKRKCQHCSKENTFDVPDHNARVRAIELWLEQFGKPPTDTTDDELDLSVDVASLSLEERANLKRSILKTYPGLAEEVRAAVKRRDDMPRTTMAIPKKRAR
jgi:hypothetical protein